jgi:hypothetical protein
MTNADPSKEPKNPQLEFNRLMVEKLQDHLLEQVESSTPWNTPTESVKARFRASHTRRRGDER